MQGVLAEANVAEEAIEEIKKAEKNEKIIVDLGAGIYAEAMLDNNDRFKTAFAGNILLNSDAKKTKEHLTAQKEMIQKEIGVVSKEFEQTVAVESKSKGSDVKQDADDQTTMELL